jgi:hypothetical protein
MKTKAEPPSYSIQKRHFSGPFFPPLPAFRSTHNFQLWPFGSRRPLMGPYNLTGYPLLTTVKTRPIRTWALWGTDLRPCLTESVYADEKEVILPEMPSKPQTEKASDWKWFIGTLLAVIVALGGFYGLIHHDLTAMEERIDGIDKHLTKVEIAVRIIAAKQNGDTKALVDEALTAARNAADSGNTASAQRILSITNRLLAQQKDMKTPVSEDFFKTALESYRSLRLVPNPAISREAFAGKTTLAEYRSAINTIPLDSHPKTKSTTLRAARMDVMGDRFYISHAFLSGNAIDNTGGQGFDIDGAVLEDVILENMTIVYNGGPITLRGVRFVDCTLRVTTTPRADQLLEAIIQQPSVSMEA